MEKLFIHTAIAFCLFVGVVDELPLRIDMSRDICFCNTTSFKLCFL